MIQKINVDKFTSKNNKFKTTATDKFVINVADKAVAIRRDSVKLHPTIKYVTIKIAKNGAKKDKKPIKKLSLNLSFIKFKSTSVPAKNVKKIPPKLATQLIQGSISIIPKLPAITPKIISTIVIETPNLIEIKLPTKISNPKINGK